MYLIKFGLDSYEKRWKRLSEFLNYTGLGPDDRSYNKLINKKIIVINIRSLKKQYGHQKQR